MPLVRVGIVALNGRDRDLRTIKVDLLRLIATYDVEPTISCCDRWVRPAHAHRSHAAPFVL